MGMAEKFRQFDTLAACACGSGTGYSQYPVPAQPDVAFQCGGGYSCLVHASIGGVVAEVTLVKESTMPRSLPLCADLVPHLDGRPLRPHEVAEVRAVRLALAMVVAVLHQQEFLRQHRPIPGGHEADMRWLFAHLEPMARVSPTVRKIHRLFDLRRYGSDWYNPVNVRRNLQALSQDAVLLGSVMAAITTSAQPRRCRRRICG